MEKKLSDAWEQDDKLTVFGYGKKAAAEEILKDFNPTRFSIDTWCEIRSLVEEKKEKFGIGSEKDSTAACTMPKPKSRDSMEAGAVVKLRDNSDVSTKCSSEKPMTKKKAVKANIDWVNKVLSDLNRINGVD